MLSACSELSDVRDALDQAIGKVLYYELSEETDGTTTVSLYIDYAAEEIEAKCAHVSETESDYTMEDLRRKCRWLSSMYVASAGEAETWNRRYGNYTNGLRADILKELDRCDRKFEFFAWTNPTKADVIEGQIKAYERVLTLIEYHQQQNQTDDP